MVIFAEDATAVILSTEREYSTRQNSSENSSRNINKNEIEAALCYRDPDDRSTDHDHTTKEAVCQRPSCHDTVDTVRVMTDDGVKTLCRPCRKQFFGVSS